MVTVIFVTERLRNVLHQMRRDVFQAIADPVRRQIIDLLSREPHTINGVAEKFEISRPAVSKHIKILRECGMLQVIPHGRERYCIIIPDGLSQVSEWLEQHRVLWEEKIDSFEEYLMELKTKKEQDEHST